MSTPTADARHAELWPDASGHFGPYGGRYVPETLMEPLRELEAAWAEAQARPGVRGRARPPAARLRRPPHAARVRGTALRAARLPHLAEARGPLPHRRAQDQQRPRPGAARQADGQVARGGGDRRRAARRRDRHGVRAARPRVRRLHGHRGHGAPGAERGADAPARRRGARRGLRHAHAQGRDQRGDARLGHERAHDPLPAGIGARRPSLPGAGARVPVRDRPRGAGAGARGGRTAARLARRLRRRGLERDRPVLRLPRGRGRRRWWASRRAGAAPSPASTPRASSREGRRRRRRRAAGDAHVPAPGRGGQRAAHALGLRRPRLSGGRPGARAAPRRGAASATTRPATTRPSRPFTCWPRPRASCPRSSPPTPSPGWCARSRRSPERP